MQIMIAATKVQITAVDAISIIEKTDTTKTEVSKPEITKTVANEGLDIAPAPATGIMAVDTSLITLTIIMGGDTKTEASTDSVAVPVEATRVAADHKRIEVAVAVTSDIMRDEVAVAVTSDIMRDEVVAMAEDILDIREDVAPAISDRDISDRAITTWVVIIRGNIEAAGNVDQWAACTTEVQGTRDLAIRATEVHKQATGRSITLAGQIRLTNPLTNPSKLNVAWAWGRGDHLSRVVPLPTRCSSTWIKTKTVS